MEILKLLENLHMKITYIVYLKKGGMIWQEKMFYL